MTPRPTVVTLDEIEAAADGYPYRSRCLVCPPSHGDHLSILVRTEESRWWHLWTGVGGHLPDLSGLDPFHQPYSDTEWERDTVGNLVPKTIEPAAGKHADLIPDHDMECCDDPDCEETHYA